jgi:DMSO/TMAO reductase YedYZ heme-binding membrane subunit
MNEQIWWYVARGSGIVAWGIMALGMFWGLALSSRFLGSRAKPNWMLDLHRFLGGLSVVFIGTHIASLVLDSYVSFGWLDILVPGATTYQPLAVAWGVIAMYLALAVEVTSLLRKRMSKRAWRRTHFLSFPLFAISTVHLLSVGTDSSTPLLRFAVLATVVAIAIATAVRGMQASRHRSVSAASPTGVARFTSQTG